MSPHRIAKRRLYAALRNHTVLARKKRELCRILPEMEEGDKFPVTLGPVGRIIHLRNQIALLEEQVRKSHILAA